MKNVSGKLAFSESYNNVDFVDINILEPAGNYFVEIITEKFISTHKVIKF